MQILQLTSVPIDQVSNLEALEWRLGEWFASITYPVRLLAFSRAFDLRPAIARLTTDQRDLQTLARAVASLMTAIDSALADASAPSPAITLRAMPAGDRALLRDLVAHDPALVQVLGDATPATTADLAGWALLADALDSLLWRLPWLKEQARFYERLQDRHLRSATYILITWEPPSVSAQTLVATLRHATGREVAVLDHLPSVVGGAYQLESQRLQPERVGGPWLAGAISHTLQGAIDLATLHPLLHATYDVVLAIDITTYTKHQARRAAQFAYNVAKEPAQQEDLLDTAAGGIKASAREVLHELRQQQLHTVQLAVLVHGPTEDELEANLADTLMQLGTQIGWMRPPYQQGEILKFFSTTPRRQIDAPLKPRPLLSHGVGCLAGVLTYHRTANTDGILFGVDAMRRSPVIVKLVDANQAGHTVIMGMTGFGKTLFLNLLTERAVVTQGYRFIGIDDFDNGPRVEQALGAGASCAMLSLDHGLNILDIVYDDDAEGGWLASQVQHVIGQLALLLGRPGKTLAGKEMLIPRAFETEEEGLLDRALMLLYAPLTPDLPLAEMPLLSDLIAILETFHEPEALRLARVLRIKLFGTDTPDTTTLTTAGACFNRHTTIDWRFGADVTYYNTSHVPQQYRPFFYLQIIGAILRFMRDPRRDRSRVTLLAIDEFWYVTQTDAVARLAALIVKVARKYRIVLVPIDQNPMTFLETETGRYILENSPHKLAFRLDESPARQLATAIRDMREEHVAALTQFAPGQCMVVLKNDIYLVNVEMSPREWRVFDGS